MYIKKLKKSIRFFNKSDVLIILALLLLIIIPLLFFKSDKTEVSSKQVTLYLSPYCEELFGKDITKAILSEFEDMNPNIQIKLAYNINSPEETDILIFDDGDFSSLVAAGALLELNSFISQSFGSDPSYDQSQQYDLAGSHLAVPLASFMNLLFYNIDILTAAGFDHPPKTRSELTNYARTVSRRDIGASGLALSLSPEDNFALSRDVFSWMWANGINFWSEGDKPAFNSVTLRNEITFLRDLNRDGLLAADIFETTGEQRLEQFTNGEVAMMIASSRIIPYLRGKMSDNAFGITIIPDSVTGGRYSTGLTSIYTGINSNCANPREAWNFLVFLIGKSSLFCAELKAVPGVVSDIIPGDYVRNDTFYSKAWDIFEASRIVEGFSGKPGAEQYEAIFLDELRAFFVTNRTAQETVNAIQRRWDEVEITP